MMMVATTYDDGRYHAFIDISRRIISLLSCMPDMHNYYTSIHYTVVKISGTAR